jgi:hypothetical protein
MLVTPLEREVFFISFNISSPSFLFTDIFPAASTVPTGPRAGKIKKQKNSVRIPFYRSYRAQVLISLNFSQVKNSPISKEIIDNSDDENLPPIPQSPLPEELQTGSDEVDLIDKPSDNTVILPHTLLVIFLKIFPGVYRVREHRIFVHGRRSGP